MEKVGIWLSDVCDGALPDRNRWASFVSYSKMMRTIALLVHGLMVGSGQYKTLLWYKSFMLLYNASEPLDVPVKAYAYRLTQLFYM